MSRPFFPALNRSKYTTKQDGSWYVYSYYKAEITNDCLERCVYCDAHIQEIGHEGFQLDHFRPQDLFPLLANIPGNLVIGCQKCNRWKSSHWPVDINSGDSYLGNIGFLDAFSHNRLDFFHVEDDGILTPLQGPSEYMIKLLNLNRPSRVIVRRNRILSCKLDQLIELSRHIVEQALVLVEEGKPHGLIREKLQLAKTAMEDIKKIRKALT
ncbi:MAG: HNH endonuclease signature motif containing protein [Methylophilaceae bacterium]